jgi:hypothetical protein
MSRNYDVSVEVDEQTAIAEKIEDEYSGEKILYGGESEEDYAKRIKGEIWTKIGYYVPIIIRMTYLDDLPYEEYESTEEEYKEYEKEIYAKKKLKVDDKILVWSNNSNEKQKAHFAYYSVTGSRVATFTDGKTSFTSENGDASFWSNWELYDEQSEDCSNWGLDDEQSEVDS